MRFLPLVLILLSGCFPYKFTTTPAVHGTIIDATTGAPIPGAQVLVSEARPNLAFFQDPKIGDRNTPTDPTVTVPPLAQVIAKARPPTVITAADGAFSIPAKHRWWIYFIPMDVFEPSGTLLVRRPGYTDLTVPLVGLKLDAGPVRLTSLPYYYGR
jgi:hypothetical protein